MAYLKKGEKMKKVILSLVVFASFCNATYVNGYYKKNGTYVEGHYRSNPNSSTYDNYSTYGNTNPYTNERGTKHYNYGWQNTC